MISKINFHKNKLKSSSQKRMQGLDINKYSPLTRKKIKNLFKIKMKINNKKLVALKTQTDKMQIKELIQ